jgi:hypothetical protein
VHYSASPTAFVRAGVLVQWSRDASHCRLGTLLVCSASPVVAAWYVEASTAYSCDVKGRRTDLPAYKPAPRTEPVRLRVPELPKSPLLLRLLFPRRTRRREAQARQLLLARAQARPVATDPPWRGSPTPFLPPVALPPHPSRLTDTPHPAPSRQEGWKPRRRRPPGPPAAGVREPRRPRPKPGSGHAQ